MKRLYNNNSDTGWYKKQSRSVYHPKIYYLFNVTCSKVNVASYKVAASDNDSHNPAIITTLQKLTTKAIKFSGTTWREIKS